MILFAPPPLQSFREIRGIRVGYSLTASAVQNFFQNFRSIIFSQCAACRKRREIVFFYLLTNAKICCNFASSNRRSVTHCTNCCFGRLASAASPSVESRFEILFCRASGGPGRFGQIIHRMAARADRGAKIQDDRSATARSGAGFRPVIRLRHGGLHPDASL